MSKEQLIDAVLEKAPKLTGDAFVKFIDEMQAMVMRDKKILSEQPVEIIQDVYNRHFA